MSEETGPELAPHLRAALLAIDLDGGPSEPARARLAEKLASATGLAVGVLNVSVSVNDPGSAAGGAGGGGAAAGTAAGKTFALVLAAALVGAGVGFAVSELRPRRAVSEPRDALVIHLDAPPMPDAQIDLPPPPADAPAADAGSSTPAQKTDSLARERQLLDAARAALRSDDLRLATKSLVEHELRYPRGALVEERRVLAIEVAVKQGEPGKARALADSFLADHPRSVFRARVEELVSGSP